MTRRSGGGIDPNVAGAFAYVLGPLSGVLMLVLAGSLVRERAAFVRFHALQSILTFVGAAIVHLALRSLPFGGLLAVLFVIAIFVLWVVLIVKALAGQTYKLPFIGDLASGQLP